MSGSTVSDLRCPRCSAHVAAGAHWCTLCYADLQAQPEPEPAASAGPGAETAPAAPQGRRRKPVEDTPTEGDPVVDQLFARLVATESGTPMGRYSGLVDTPAKKVGLMVGGAVLAMLLLFLVMAGVGALL